MIVPISGSVNIDPNQLIGPLSPPGPQGIQESVQKDLFVSSAPAYTVGGVIGITFPNYPPQGQISVLRIRGQ